MKYSEMSSAERNDLKSALRKREFPFCAREALSKAEELLCSSVNLNKQQLIKQTELTMELISEFVFSEVDRRGMRRKLTSIQELELMQVICDHMLFSSESDASKNSLFLSLFPIQATERKKFVVNLVSFAISTRNIPILTAMGVLLQQVGCSSPYSCSFARKLVAEFFLLVPVDSLPVLDLPKIAPLFTANFLTAVSETYSFTEGKQKIILPPVHLLEMILAWIRDNPGICFAPLIDKLQPVLLNLHGAIPMPPITPYVGLIKWCILSVLDDSAPLNLYLSLENLLLESLMTCSSTLGLVHLNVILTQDLVVVINPLMAEGLGPERLNKATDSLAKVIRVGLITNTLCGPKQELRRHLEVLPPNELMGILLQSMPA